MAKKDKDKDVSPRERLEDEKAIKELRKIEELKEALRRDAEKRDRKDKK